MAASWLGRGRESWSLALLSLPEQKRVGFFFGVEAWSCAGRAAGVLPLPAERAVYQNLPAARAYQTPPERWQSHGSPRLLSTTSHLLL